MNHSFELMIRHSAAKKLHRQRSI